MELVNKISWVVVSPGHVPAQTGLYAVSACLLRLLEGNHKVTEAIWQENNGQGFTAELCGMHLAVSRVGESKMVRFLVRKQTPLSLDLFLMQSGYRESLEQAMKAAEHVAEQLSYDRRL